MAAGEIRRRRPPRQMGRQASRQSRHPGQLLVAQGSQNWLSSGQPVVPGPQARVQRCSPKTHSSSEPQSSWSSHCPGSTGTQAATQSSHAGQLPVAQGSQISPGPHGLSGSSGAQTSAHSPVANTHTESGGQSPGAWHPLGPVAVETTPCEVVAPPEPFPPAPAGSITAFPPHANQTTNKKVVPPPATIRFMLAMMADAAGWRHEGRLGSMASAPIS